jgi:hypothetical protein
MSFPLKNHSIPELAYNSIELIDNVCCLSQAKQAKPRNG